MSEADTVSSATRWLDEQLREYGGVSQRGDVNGYVRVVLDALATVERERDSLMAKLAASQAETLGLREERDTLLKRLEASATGLATLNDRIAELEGALEDVRRVEADLRGNALHRLMVDSLGNMAMFTYGNAKFASADSLAALGRMLKGVADAPLSSSPQAQNTEGE